MKSMKSLAFLPLALIVALPSGSVLALPTRTIFAEQAQGVSGSGVNLEVPPGYGLAIFIETGQTVTQAWLGDPSRFVFSSNGNLCPQGLQDSNCTNTGATVIFLRQIQPVEFPGLVSSSDGGTQLILITEGSEGQKQYSFGLSAASRGKIKYRTVTIKPDEQKFVPSPILPSRQIPTPTAPPSVIDQLPTTTSSIQRQTAFAQNPSSNTAINEQPLAVPTPPPSFARAATRVSSAPIPQTNWIPESSKQPVRASTPKRSPTSTKLATSPPQKTVAAPNRPSSYSKSITAVKSCYS